MIWVHKKCLNKIYPIWVHKKRLQKIYPLLACLLKRLELSMNSNKKI